MTSLYSERRAFLEQEIATAEHLLKENFSLKTSTKDKGSSSSMLSAMNLLEYENIVKLTTTFARVTTVAKIILGRDNSFRKFLEGVNTALRTGKMVAQTFA